MFFLAEERDLHKGSSNSRGSLVDHETHELHGRMRRDVSSLFLRSLFSDTGEIADVRVRTDAKNPCKNGLNNTSA